MGEYGVYGWYEYGYECIILIWVNKVITGDKIWVFEYDPEIKT